jgi:hypothetical protein
LDKILREHQTQPLDDAAAAELRAILGSAEREIGE